MATNPKSCIWVQLAAAHGYAMIARFIPASTTQVLIPTTFVGFAWMRTQAMVHLMRHNYSHTSAPKPAWDGLMETCLLNLKS